MRNLTSLALGAPLLLAACGAAAEHKAPVPVEASAIPSGTYAQRQCGGAPRGWVRRRSEAREPETYNRVSVAGSEIRWNGVSIDLPILSAYLVQIRKMQPQPVTALVVAPDADCGTLASVRTVIDAKAACRRAPSCAEYGEAAWLAEHPAGRPPLESTAN